MLAEVVGKWDGIRFAGGVITTVSLCGVTWEAVTKSCVCSLFHCRAYLKDVNQRKEVVSGTEPPPTT